MLRYRGSYGWRSCGVVGLSEDVEWDCFGGVYSGVR